MAEQRFPIMGGASVPWSVMAPHDWQAKKNHCGQSLEELARRGGLDPTEAICVVRGWDYFEARKQHSTESLVTMWAEFAERIQGIVAERDALQAKLDAAKGLVGKWRKEARDAVHPDYAKRDLHYKYLRLDNEAAGWNDCADELARVLDGEGK